MSNLQFFSGKLVQLSRSTIHILSKQPTIKSFVNSIFLSIYFSKYLQFPLSTIRHSKIMLLSMFFYKIMALKNENFLFLQILFSQLWRTLARKLLNRSAVFITYFQSSFQIVHVYQVSRSDYFFQVWRLLRENLWKEPPIFWLIFKLPIIMCMLKKFCRLKIFTKKMATLSKC